MCRELKKVRKKTMNYAKEFIDNFRKYAAAVAAEKAAGRGTRDARIARRLLLRWARWAL